MTATIQYLSLNLPALCVLGVVFCWGGIAGIWLAWTHEARFARWAARVESLYVTSAGLIDGVAADGDAIAEAASEARPGDRSSGSIPRQDSGGDSR